MIRALMKGEMVGPVMEKTMMRMRTKETMMRMIEG